jgi:hypothetical protein
VPVEGIAAQVTVVTRARAKSNEGNDEEGEGMDVVNVRDGGEWGEETRRTKGPRHEEKNK